MKTENTHIQAILTGKKSLKQILSGIDPSIIKKLTITGKIREKDIAYIHDKMASTLLELDMSNASIKGNKWISIFDSTSFVKLRSISIGVSIKNHTYSYRIVRQMLVTYGNPEIFETTETCSLFDIPALRCINVHPDNPVYYSENGVLFKKEKDWAKTKSAVLIKFPPNKTGNYIIPDSVVKIADNAFVGCSGLKAVTLPYSITTIENGAFNRCSAYIVVDPKNPNYKSIDGHIYEK